jgi:hypothetical protein
MKGMKLIVACALAGAAGYWHVAPVGAIPVCGFLQWVACPGCVPHTPDDLFCACDLDSALWQCVCVDSHGQIQSDMIVTCYYHYYWFEYDWEAPRLGAVWDKCERYDKCKTTQGPYNCATLVTNPTMCIPTGQTPCDWRLDHWGNDVARFFYDGACQ